MDHLQAKITKYDDGSIFTDDCAEVFLSPVETRGFYQFVTNTRGVRWDAI